MTPRELIDAFEVVAEAPDGVKRLRELVLQLAVRGKLVPQDPADEPASAILDRLHRVRRSTLAPDAASWIEPDDVPVGWVAVPFGRAFVEIFTGPFGTSLKAAEYVSEGVPVINPQNMRAGRIVPTPDTCVGVGTVDRLSAFVVMRRDVVVARRGEMGRCAVVGEAESGWLCGTGSLVLRPPPDVVSDFVALFLRSPDTAHRLAGDSVGSTMANLNQRIMVNLPFGLPPTAEQHRIVARVDELMGVLDRLEAARKDRDATRDAARDSALAALRDADTPDEVEVAWNRIAERMPELFTRPADLEPLRQAVLQLAVRGRLVRQDPNDEQATVLFERMAANGEPSRDIVEPPFMSGSVPERWRWSTLGSCCDCRLGKMLDAEKNSGVPRTYLRNTNVHWFRFDLSSLKEMRVHDGELAELLLRKDDVLVCEGGHGIGRSAVWRGQLEGVVFQKALHRCRPGRMVLGDFVCYWMRVLDCIGALEEQYTGAGIPHLTGRALQRLPIPLPPLAEQHRIVAKVDALMALIDQLEASLTAATDLHAQFAAAAVHHLGA